MYMNYKGTRQTGFEKVLQLELLLNRKGGLEVWNTLLTTTSQALSVSILLSDGLSSELQLPEMSLVPHTASKPLCHTTKLKKTGSSVPARRALSSSGGRVALKSPVRMSEKKGRGWALRNSAHVRTWFCRTLALSDGNFLSIGSTLLPFPPPSLLCFFLFFLNLHYYTIQTCNKLRQNLKELQRLPSKGRRNIHVN